MTQIYLQSIVICRQKTSIDEQSLLNRFFSMKQWWLFSYEIIRRIYVIDKLTVKSNLQDLTV